MDLKSKIILIYGPTASGKSKFAVTLAKKVNGEIINADSMQVYKQLNILTARPTIKEQKKPNTFSIYSPLYKTTFLKPISVQRTYTIVLPKRHIKPRPVLLKVLSSCCLLYTSDAADE